MGARFPKNDIGENIWSRLVCTMVALDLLRNYPEKKIPDEMRRLLELAKEEIINDNPTLRQFFDVFLFEDLPAKGKSPASAYLKHVSSSDIYIGIIGKDYGEKGPDDISATEREFRQFLKANPDGEVIVFIQGTSTDDTKRDKDSQDFVKAVKADYIYKRFRIKNLEGNHNTRNEKICNIFHETMDMEKFGTGIGKMKRLMKEHGLAAPKFSEEGDFFVVKFYGPGEKILDLVPSIPEHRQTDLKKLGLNERQIEALRLMVNEKVLMTNKEFREKFHVTDRTALRDLNILHQPPSGGHLFLSVPFSVTDQRNIQLKLAFFKAFFRLA